MTDKQPLPLPQHWLSMFAVTYDGDRLIREKDSVERPSFSHSDIEFTRCRRDRDVAGLQNLAELVIARRKFQSKSPAAVGERTRLIGFPYTVAVQVGEHAPVR